jgi:hypothetical protein
MSQPQAALPTLECSAIVYRAARKRWVQRTESADTVLPEAFLLRPQETGLSVCLAASLSPQQCATLLTGCKSVLSLHVGRVRNIGLEVVPDSAEHAEIHGLPNPIDQAAEAARCAGILAKQARVIRIE